MLLIVDISSCFTIDNIFYGTPCIILLVANLLMSPYLSMCDAIYSDNDLIKHPQGSLMTHLMPPEPALLNTLLHDNIKGVWKSET